jgi:hypothetical protein
MMSSFDLRRTRCGTSNRNRNRSTRRIERNVAYSRLSLLAVAALLLLAATLISCHETPLRGDSERSPDGKTYLAIMDRNNCSQLQVDGKDWPWQEGVRRPVSPGTHQISCGGESPIEFTVREGETFNFDYWGP